MARSSTAKERRLVVVWLVCIASSAVLTTATRSAADSLPITSVSSPPDLVTGGDVLIGIAPSGAAAGPIRATLNGAPLSVEFRPGRTSGLLLGRIPGLQIGRNQIRVESPGAQGELAVVDHPITGPLFNSRHQSPFICQTVEAGLGPPRDADCSARPVVTYFYKSSGPALPFQYLVPPGRWPSQFKAFDPAKPRPGDIAKTTTSDGRVVDYIIRSETGTINRAIYQIAMLQDPARALPDPWTAPSAWNGRLVYLFGHSCSAGYRQGLVIVSPINDVLLSQGFAVATSSLNMLGNDCDDVVSAETMSMVKEHFIKEFGPPAHTIGWGESGGAIQQYLIAQNYPGLLDGIVPAMSYPDVVSLIEPVTDCALLAHAFSLVTATWNEEQKTAVSGYASWKTCSGRGFLASSWLGDGNGYALNWVKADACPPPIPKAFAYDPVKNPNGIRCDLYDNQIQVWGRDPVTGIARRPLDNVGVQYGLAAFNQGKITADQFLELNALIGGFDADGKIVLARMRADPEALRIAYATGRINGGGGGLASIPIIDVRPYRDTMPNIHDRIRSAVIRRRLIAANGSADNQVLLTLHFDGRFAARDPASAYSGRWKKILLLMDAWLTNIEADRDAAPSAIDRIARNRPKELRDACWTEDGVTVDDDGRADGACGRLYPLHADPRLVAGAPPTEDVLKCALKPIDQADYARPLTQAQRQRLSVIFPDGVCDYSKAGIGQQRLESTWRRY